MVGCNLAVLCVCISKVHFVYCIQSLFLESIPVFLNKDKFCALSLHASVNITMHMYMYV